MFAKFGKDLVSKNLIEAVKTVMHEDEQKEELKGGQVKLDKNRNGKLDSQDFKMLRGEKKVDEAEAEYQASAKYRGKVADFRPKSTDVGQGRKITGKLGKYGKQPDDDNMVEPPKDHTVGDVKTDPSTVVPGYKSTPAKLHLATLPKDAEGKPIYKGARKVNAADLVAKRKAMMAADKKNEYVEEVSEADNLALRGLVSTDPKNAGRFLSTQKGKENRAKKNVPELKSDIKRQLGRHPKPNLPEEAIEEGMEDTLHPAGAALLKHIKPQHHNLYKSHLTKDVFNGSYGDRTSVLKAAKDAGHLKMDLKKQNEEVEDIEEAKKQPLSAYERLKKNMKKKGYDLDAREKFWTDKLKQMDTQKKESVEFPFAKSLIEKTEKEMKEKKDVVMPEEDGMTDKQKERREKFVIGMKDKTPQFKEKYGKRWKEVMYATATKMAMKEEETIDEKLDRNVRTIDTLRGSEAGGKDNEHLSYKVKLEDEKTKDTVKKTKEIAKNAFKRVRNETMMGKISN
jgi:hypothetical protein